MSIEKTVPVTIRWAGPPEAKIGDRYKILRYVYDTGVLTYVNEVDANSPYASPKTTLSSNATYGDTTVELADASSFPSSGWAWLSDALISWSGKSADNLTGVEWFSGNGTYETGTDIYQAHESYSESVTTNENALGIHYQVIRVDGSDDSESAPSHFWQYDLPAPATSEHCVVLVHLVADLAATPLEGIEVRAYLAAPDVFATKIGVYLNPKSAPDMSQRTDSQGMAVFQCWRKSAIKRSDGSDTKYTFVLDAGDTPQSFEVEIPDRNWVLLHYLI